MKKTILLIILLIATTSCAVNNVNQYKHQQLEPGTSDVNDVKTLYEGDIIDFATFIPWLAAKDGKNTVLILFYGDYVNNIIVFSPEREYIDSIAKNKKEIVMPIKFEENLEDFLYEEFKVIEEKYGKCHFTEGSGFYMPCYVLDGGYYVLFYVNDTRVSSICKYDIMSCEMVESYE